MFPNAAQNSYRYRKAFWVCSHRVHTYYLAHLVFLFHPLPGLPLTKTAGTISPGGQKKHETKKRLYI